MSKINHYLKEAVGKPTYGITKWIYNKYLKSYFSFEVEGLENLPEESAVLAINHHSGLDGFLIAANISRQVHYLTQVSGVNSHPVIKFLMWAYGEIPIIIPEASNTVLETLEEKEKRTKEQMANMNAMRRARDYLKLSRDYVGVFVDGPAKNLRDEHFRIKPLEERTCSESAVILASATNRLVIPIGIRAPERMTHALWEYNWKDRKQKAEWIRAYVAERGRIQYKIKIGEPIDPKSSSYGKNGEKRKVEVSRALKEAIIELG